MSEPEQFLGLNQDPKVGNVKITIQEYHGGQWAFLEGTEEQFRELYESIKEMIGVDDDGWEDE